MKNSTIQKAFLNCDNIYLFSIFFNRFSRVEKCGITPYCSYRDSLILSMSRHIKRNRKGEKLQLFSILVLSFSVRHSCIKKLFGKLMKLIFFKAGNITIHLKGTDSLLNVFSLFLFVIVHIVIF